MSAPARWICAVSIVFLLGCGGSTAPTPDPGRVEPTEEVGPCGSGSDTATFEITLTGTWTAATHPGNFPAGAHFSGLVGAAHKTIDIVWVRDGVSVATNGIEVMAETGSTTTLGIEIDGYIASGSAAVKILANNIGATGVATAMFTTTKQHRLLSLTTMVAPSPDWFLGVANFDLCDGGDWIDDVTLDLTQVYDSATDNGLSFTSPDADQTPHLPIRLVADEGNHFLTPPAPLATLRIRRVP